MLATNQGDQKRKKAPKSRQNSCQAKKAKISTSKLNLKAQNISDKPQTTFETIKTSKMLILAKNVEFDSTKSSQKCCHCFGLLLSFQKITMGF